MSDPDVRTPPRDPEHEPHDAESECDAADNDSVRPDRPVIFISYRIDPDQPVAAALKRLIETAIDPSPEAFVSGVGGLHASRDAFKAQLQKVAQRARAFVGVVSHASRDREWLYFEAGAAWGLNLAYAPLLIDTTARDLPSTIADYFAFRATNVDEVQRLLEDLAKAVGGTVRTHFARRYQPFAKALAKYQKGGVDGEESGDSAEQLPRDKARQLLQQGKRAEARAAYDTLEHDAASDEERASVRFERLIAETEPGDPGLLERVESLDDSFKTSAEYSFWMGTLEPRPLVAIAHLERCLLIAKKGSFEHRQATLMLALLHANLAHERDALRILAGAIRSGDRQLCTEAVQQWIQGFKDLSAESKLVLLTLGLAGGTLDGRASALKAVAELALDESWPGLLARYSKALVDTEDTPSSSHLLGRAYQALKLPSLAYRAFSKAEKGGVTVSKAALADLLRSTGVAAAGLDLLEGYAGPFDAASPAYPYYVRARIEESLEEEENQRLRLARLGRQLDSQLALVADLALQDANQLNELSEKVHGRVEAAIHSNQPSAPSLATLLDGRGMAPPTLTFSRALQGFNVWLVRQSGKLVAVIHASGDGAFAGFEADIRAADGPVTSLLEHAKRDPVGDDPDARRQ